MYSFVVLQHFITLRLFQKRFHVAMRLFSNRTQMKSKFGKNKKAGGT